MPRKDKTIENGKALCNKLADVIEQHCRENGYSTDVVVAALLCLTEVTLVEWCGMTNEQAVEEMQTRIDMKRGTVQVE